MTQARNLSRLLNKDITTYMYTATAGQTAFTGSDNNSQTLTFDNQSIMVTYNGVMLEKGSEFTVATNTVTLLAGAEVNAEVNVIVFNNASLGGYVKSTGGDIDGNVTINGAISATSFTGSGSGLTGVDAATVSTTAPSSPTQGDMWFDSTTGTTAMYVWNGSSWDQMSNKFSALGGTVTTYSSGGINYKVHTFTSSGTFTAKSSGEIELLMVAGGGGGGTASSGAGAAGGGGGAGGLIYNASKLITTGTHTITIGGGGAGSTDNTANAGTGGDGADTTGFSLTAVGGGGGGSRDTVGNPGGSGGGTNASNVLGEGSYGAGTAGQGNRGGDGGNIPSPSVGSGGGGAGAVGQTTDYNSTTVGGNGGAGLGYNIRTGSTVYYAGGGGGGGGYNAGGNGGSNIGADGANGDGTNSSRSISAPNNAIVNGGGGGGGSAGTGNGSNGSSGIVVVRYAI
jgi:hypothetical protein